MDKKDLLINGTSLNSLGIYITSDTYLNAPQIDYTEFQIPGRNGSVVLDNKRLNNVIRRFDCYIPDRDVEIKANGLYQLKKLLYSNRGYVRLHSSYDSTNTEYQMGYLAEGLDVNPFLTKSASFSLYFSCLPQRMVNDNQEFNATLSGEETNGRLYLPGDPFVMKYLAKAKHDYPSSIIGWLHLTAISSIPNGASATIRLVSDTTQKYMIINSATGAVVKEIQNYRYAFTYNNTSGVTRWLDYLVPVTADDIRITATTTTGNAFDCILTYGTFTGSGFALPHYDCSPYFRFTHTINTDYHDTCTLIDVFTLNEGIYVVDLASFVADYGEEYILSNLAINRQIDGETVKTVLFELDAVNGKLFAIPSSNKKLDISGYLTMSKPEYFGSPVTAKGTSFTQGADEFFDPYMYSTATFNMRWWDL